MTFPTSRARLQAATRAMAPTRRYGFAPVAERHSDAFSKIIEAQLSAMYARNLK